MIFLILIPFALGSGCDFSTSDALGDSMIKDLDFSSSTQTSLQTSVTCVVLQTIQNLTVKYTTTSIDDAYYLFFE